MIIRIPDGYFFQYSGIMNRESENYFRNSSTQRLMVKYEDEDDVYSFKFADDEYVEEATK